MRLKLGRGRLRIEGQDEGDGVDPDATHDADRVGLVCVDGGQTYHGDLVEARGRAHGGRAVGGVVELALLALQLLRRCRGRGQAEELPEFKDVQLLGLALSLRLHLIMNQSHEHL